MAIKTATVVPLNGCFAYAGNIIPAGQINAVADPEYQTANFIYGHTWQLCPKCQGDGNLFRHNSPALMSTSTDAVCDVCNGKKIISSTTGLPPQ